jgi:hypothetical protein
MQWSQDAWADAMLTYSRGFFWIEPVHPLYARGYSPTQRSPHSHVHQPRSRLHTVLTWQP